MLIDDDFDNPTGFLGPAAEPNCGVTAVALIAGEPFAHVFALIKAQQSYGPRWKGRTYLSDRTDALCTLGVPHRTVYHPRYKARGKRSLASWARRLPHGVTFMVDVTGHTVTMRDGKIIDQVLRAWTPAADTRSARKMVRSIVRIGEDA